MNTHEKMNMWPVFLLVGVVLVSGVLALMQTLTRKEPAQDLDKRVEIILNEETCRAASGTWDTSTIFAQCVCTSNTQCPFGFTCEPLSDRTVCIESSDSSSSSF